MYGKIFEKMYEGSMAGSGSHVFSVWGYCISKADPESHTIDLNPVVLAALIGDTKERMQEAIAFLSNPDPDSHNKDHEGRRIIPTTGHEFFVVSHEAYRSMKNNEELREYFRESKRRQRLSKTVQDSPGMSTDPASASASVSASDSAEGIVKGGAKGWTIDDCRAIAAGIGMPSAMIDEFWAHYAAVDWIDAAGRKICNLAAAMSKWKANQPSRGKKYREISSNIGKSGAIDCNER